MRIRIDLLRVAFLVTATVTNAASAQTAQTPLALPTPLSTPGPTFTVPEPALPKSPTILVYGDMRFHDPSNVTVADPVARKLLVEQIATLHPDAVQLTGDVPYRGNNLLDYANYHEETAPWRTAQLRIYPALGNHEFVGTDKLQDLQNWWSAFPELTGRRWYSVALGRRVYLINLDSNSDLTAGSAQMLWVQDQVKHLAKTVDFVFIAMHHPPVADLQTHIEVDHNPRPNEIALRDYLSSVAPRAHAQFIVTAGHIHNYERFVVSGVTYLVSGGGGAKPYIVERTPEDLYQSNDFPNFHYVVFRLEGKQVTATMFRLDDAASISPKFQPKDSFIIIAH